PRKRTLQDWELRAIWAAAEATEYPYGPLIKVLMMSGQRRSEIAKARRGEIDLDDAEDAPALVREWRNMLGTIGAAALLTIVGDRMKEEADHTVPLTPRVVNILKALPRFTFTYVFSGKTGAAPFSGFSKAKKRLDATVEEIAGRSI